jgi:hypothetical protein
MITWIAAPMALQRVRLVHMTFISFRSSWFARHVPIVSMCVALIARQRRRVRRRLSGRPSADRLLSAPDLIRRLLLRVVSLIAGEAVALVLLPTVTATVVERPLVNRGTASGKEPCDDYDQRDRESGRQRTQTFPGMRPHRQSLPRPAKPRNGDDVESPFIHRWSFSNLGDRHSSAVHRSC